MEYKILIIDDEYYDRKDTYHTFFEEQFREGDICFSVSPVSTAGKLELLYADWEHVDAIFLDARLDGWGDDYNYYGVLSRIENHYHKSCTPPVFMVSKHWPDFPELLNKVSINISHLNKFDHPAAFLNYDAIAGIVTEAKRYYTQPDEEMKTTHLVSLLSYRQFILDEIEKKHAVERVDAAVIFAVTDEKAAAYNMFGLLNENDKELPSDSLTYQIYKKNNKRIAFVTQNDMGLSAAARATESTINAFEPSVVVMGGICAGNQKRVSVGSIIIPKQIYEYASGKIATDTEGNPYFIERLNSVNSCPCMDAFYHYVKDDKNALSIISDIQLSYSPGVIPDKKTTKEIVTDNMASGPWVVDSEKVFDTIKNIIPNDRLGAIDMEAYAFARVAEIHNIPWLVVKTVQDYANGNKSNDEKTARSYAAFSSARFIYSQIDKIINLAESKKLS